ncbi:MAG: hypothetical protein HY800_09310, partial [Ignavibacteriales bacterium]|nr:hypothetical protein [Ignavibacteriales bacterium]
MRSNDLRFSRHLRFSILTLFGGVLLLYTISSFLPDSFLWGVNHLAFFKSDEKIFILVAALLLGLPFLSSRYIKIIEFVGRFNPPNKITLLIFFLIIGALGFGVFYHFRIGTDMYGDTRTLLSLLAGKHYTFSDIFSLADKEPLTRLIHQQLASFFNLDQKYTFQLVSSISGGVYLVVLLFFVRHLDGSVIWKFLIVVISLSSGVNQLFFGHVEDYTLVYLAIVLFLMFAWMVFDGKKMLVWMIIVFVVGIRLHIEMILMLPALLYVIRYVSHNKYPNLSKWLQLKRIITVVAATMVISILLYFFHFQAYRYNVGDQQEVMTKIFLPIENWLPPPHSYTLLTLNHFSDVIQQFLYTVSPAVVLIICSSIGCYRYLSWREPRIVFLLLAVFYFAIFDFTINPMLTMPRDWDLLSPAAASINFLAIALSRQLIGRSQKHSNCTFLVGVALAVSLISSSIFLINSDEEKAALRLEGIGKWTFKSYYHGSSYIINVGEKMMKDVQQQIEHREKTIQDLLPYASKPDINLSLLYYKLAVVYYERQLFDKASFNFSKALDYDPENASALKGKGLIALRSSNFNEAFKIFSFYNKQVNHPKVKDSQAIVYEQYARQLLKLQNESMEPSEIQKRLNQID